MKPTPSQTLVTDVRPFSKGDYLPLPFLLVSISAGFPSPADDFVDRVVDLNELAVRNPTATYLMRVQGNSMENAGIYDGDVLVVDRSLEPKNGDIVVACLCGELTVKRVLASAGAVSLVPENGAYTPIPVTEEMEFEVWGVVTHTLHRVR